MPTAPSPTKTFHKTTYPSLDPTRKELSAQGKTIVITGAGTGIGAEVAKYFAKAGASRIGILGRREQPLLDTKTAIEAENPRTQVLAIPTDVSKKSEVDAAFAKVAGDGKVDVLVSNAAVIGALGPIANLSGEDWIAGITSNLLANFNLTQTFVKHAASNAVIIETNSAVAHQNYGPGASAYSVSKTATARFYSSLATEYPDLSIFSVQPGTVGTAMAKAAGFADDDYKPNELAKAAFGEFDDANLPASFMVWLASPEARFLNGKFLWANWDVDELKARAHEIENSPFLSIGLVGWPFA